MLELKDLRFEIPGRYEIRFQGQMKSDEILCLIGPSGIGKTTLLRALAGFHPLKSGQILLNGKSIEQLSPEERHTGFLFQSHQLFPGMSVRENLEFPLRTRHPDWTSDLRTKKALEILDRARLRHLAENDSSSVSGGESQRLAFCRVLLSEPRFFLLDEPFSALDPENRKAFRDWLKEELKENPRPTLMVSHDSDDISDLGARVLKWPNEKSRTFDIFF